MLKSLALVLLVVLSLLTLSDSYKVAAIDATPNSGTRTPNQSVTLDLTAASPMPSGNFNTAVINLHITNGTVTNFIDPTGTWLTLGTCSGFVKFTSSDVCVNVSNTDNAITTGMALGQVVIQVGSSGTTTLGRITGTGYETPDPHSDYQVGVNIASFTITAATPTPTQSILPNTASSNGQLVQIGIALLLIFSGIGLYRGQKHYLQDPVY